MLLMILTKKQGKCREVLQNHDLGDMLICVKLVDVPDEIGLNTILQKSRVGSKSYAVQLSVLRKRF